MYILIFWAVIAGTSGTVHKDWRTLSEHSNLATCHAAAARLQIQRFECIKK